MNNFDDKVSIIIPTYKRSKIFLGRAIDSLLKQTYNNIEVVIVDDNAADELGKFRREVSELIESYKDTRIKYIQNRINLGGSLSRNEGINVSTGEYITFLDDDDKYLPDKVKNQLAFMISGDFDVTFTSLRLCNNKEKTIDFREFSSINSFSNDYLLKYHITRHITGTPTFMYKRDFIIRIGGFPDAKVGQEFYLMLNTIEKGAKIGYLPKSDLIAYRHDDGGISMGMNKINGEIDLYNFKKKYFHCLSSREIKFVRFRHYAVMTVAYKRNKKYYKMLINLGKTCISSPIDMGLETIKLALKIFKNSKKREKFN